MIFVFHGILDETSILRESRFARFVGENCEVKRLRIPDSATPESLFLGFPANEVMLNEGPLIVSGLGFDPPDTAAQFHLSLLSVGDGVTIPKPPKPEEAAIIKDILPKLNAKYLTLLYGEALVHGLVWERKGDHLTTSPDTLMDLGVQKSLPLGDAEKVLRMLIDDSVNLLGEQEFNLRRIDHGELPLNLLWPWGQGVRYRVPSLALRYGFPVRVNTDSLRMSGLARCAGLRPERFRETPMRTKWESQNGYDYSETSAFRKLIDIGQIEEAHWLWNESSNRLLQPVLDSAKENESPVTIIVTGKEGGISAHFNGKSQDGHFPFDSRTLEEPKCPIQDLDQAVRSYLALR